MKEDKDDGKRRLLKDCQHYDERPFFKRWLRVFAPGLTVAQYKEYIDGGYIWTVFCDNFIPKDKFLEGDAARRAYDRADKSGATCAYLTGDKDGLPLPGAALTAAGIESNDSTSGEFYVVGASYGWTYIVTHETPSGIGPFFMSRKL